MIDIDLKVVPLEDIIFELQRRGLSPLFSTTTETVKATATNKDTAKKGKDLLNTLGGKRKEFTFKIDTENVVIYRIDSGLEDTFPIFLIFNLLKDLNRRFGRNEFPLANNVALLNEKREKVGVGSLLFDMTKNITLAQGASQLVAILYESGVIGWNGKQRNMMFSFLKVPESPEELRDILRSISKSHEVDGLSLSRKSMMYVPNNENEIRAKHLSKKFTQKTFSEKNIREAIEKSRIGIVKYRNIISTFNNVDVSQNHDFQRDFNGFYRIRQRTNEWYEHYYRYMQVNRAEKPMFSEALGYLYDSLGRVEPSFCSKLVHTLDTNKPIWDQYVLSNIGITRPSYNKLDPVLDTYKLIEDWYNTFLESEDGKRCISIFDEEVAMHSEISNVKKVDFILWQMRDEM